MNSKWKVGLSKISLQKLVPKVMWFSEVLCLITGDLADQRPRTVIQRTVIRRPFNARLASLSLALNFACTLQPHSLLEKLEKCANEVKTLTD